jgi:hypothetical protein
VSIWDDRNDANKIERRGRMLSGKFASDTITPLVNETVSKNDV